MISTNENLGGTDIQAKSKMHARRLVEALRYFYANNVEVHVKPKKEGYDLLFKPAK